jgi:hypothetical protein
MPKPQDDDLTTLGIEALIPGMQHMLTRMQMELDTMRRMRVLSQDPGKVAPARLLVKRSAASPAPTLHPRDPKHPRHAAWLKKLSRSQKKAWQKRHQPAAE